MTFNKKQIIYITMLIFVIALTSFIASFGSIEPFSMSYCNKDIAPKNKVLNASVGCFTYAPSTTDTVKNIPTGRAKSFRLLPGWGVTPYTDNKCSNDSKFMINAYVNNTKEDMYIDYNTLKNDATSRNEKVIQDFKNNGIRCVKVVPPS